MIDISITINAVDKTSLIRAGSLKKTDTIDNAADILNFDIESYGDQTYFPELNDAIEMFDGVNKIFGGVIVQIDKETDQGLKITGYRVTATDYTQFLKRQKIIERIEDMTVDEIIDFLLTKYAPDFDDLYVDAPIDVASITFNNITIADALNKLSALTNYQWYVDYDMHVHFYEKNSEPSSFDLLEGDGNYIPDTLSIKEDITQIKNRVTVIGGEREVNEVTYTFKGSKGKLQSNGHKTFDLSYKFSSKPVVSVNAVSKLIGVVGFDDAVSFDAMWSFEGKYLDFTSGPGDTDDLIIAGIPLEPVQVRVQDSASIAEYGRWDAVISVPGIKSQDEARQYAEAERDAYKNPQYIANFDTYISGLRSGQIININSAKLDVNEDFVIQRVTFVMLSKSQGYWKIEAATLRQVTLIDILSRITGYGELNDLSAEGLLSYIEFNDLATLVESAPVFSTISGPYQIWPSSGSGTGQPAIVNFSTMSA